MHEELSRTDLQDRISNVFEIVSEAIDELQATEMTKRAALILVALAGSWSFGMNAVAGGFQKLSGNQIRAKFVGMQLTDQSHWGEVYWPDGTLTSEEMRRKRVGRWRVEKDRLCTDYGKDGGDNCYEVWVSGRTVQIRMPGSEDFPLEGVLEQAPKRR